MQKKNVKECVEDDLPEVHGYLSFLTDQPKISKNLLAVLIMMLFS
jgi:hypothetical protein